jgi:WD40 repeat protein
MTSICGEPMKYLGKDRFVGWRLMASIYLVALPTIALSQGRPNIVWAKGGHSDSVNSVTYSPDGQLLVSGSSDRTIKLWRQDRTFIKSLTIPYSPNGQLTDVRSVAVSPDGKLLAVGVQLFNGVSHTYTGAVEVWRISDSVLAQTLTGYGSGDSTTTGVNSVAFSHDGTLLASGAFFNGNNDAIKLWNVSNWTLLRELSGPLIFGPFTAINFSADDSLISAASEGTPAVWRVSDGAFIRNFPCCGPTRFSPNGALLAVGTDPVSVYRTSDWAQVAALSNQNQAFAFTPDGHYLAWEDRAKFNFGAFLIGRCSSFMTRSWAMLGEASARSRSRQMAAASPMSEWTLS